MGSFVGRFGSRADRVSSGVGDATSAGMTCFLSDMTGTTRCGSVGISAFGSPANERAGVRAKRRVGPLAGLGVGVCVFGPSFPAPGFGAGAGCTTKSRNSGIDFSRLNGPVLVRLT